jgi:tripartite-type tricarboxylate transporter receptor subunit TctC
MLMPASGFVLASLVTTALAVSAPVGAQGFPTKPVRVITAVGAGAPADVLCRLYSEELSQRIRQPVVVENRPGGNNVIAVNALLEAPADGYTALCFSGGGMAPALHKALPWDFLKVVEPITGIYVFGFFLVVNGKVPVNNVQEFIAHVKANPGKLNYMQLVPLQKIGFALFAQRAGIDMVEVGYKGMEAYQDLLSGRVHAAMDGPASWRGGQIESGQVKMLFTAATKRSPLLPNVPTAAEAGLGDLELPVGLQFWTKAGTPRENVMRLNAALNEVLKSPRVVESIRNTGGVATGGPPEDLRRQTEKEFKIWGDGARIANYVPQ